MQAVEQQYFTHILAVGCTEHKLYSRISLETAVLLDVNGTKGYREPCTDIQAIKRET